MALLLVPLSAPAHEWHQHSEDDGTGAQRPTALTKPAAGNQPHVQKENAKNALKRGHDECAYLSQTVFSRDPSNEE